MSNVLQFPNRTTNLSAFELRVKEMDKLELLEEYVGWTEEPGINEDRSEDWKARGRIILPALYDVAETGELRGQIRFYWKLVRIQS